jgi:hypothetical protein
VETLLKASGVCRAWLSSRPFDPARCTSRAGWHLELARTASTSLEALNAVWASVGVPPLVLGSWRAEVMQTLERA